MAEIVIYNKEKASVGKVALPAGTGKKANVALLHQVVTAQRTNRRQGNAKVKNRHEVSGSTRKIIRQKGTGGARHGDVKAPLFVGGGQAFGPKPKDYDVRLPQKIKNSALHEAVILRQEEGRLWLIDDLSFGAPKTKEAAKLFQKFEIPQALVVVGDGDAAAEKSIRNLKGFKVCRANALTVLDMLRFRHLVMTKKVYETLAARWV